MDISKIFDSLPQWSRSLTQEQSLLLDQLMHIRDSKEFSKFSAEEIRCIQLQMLRSDDDVARVVEITNAVKAMKPTVSNAYFI